MNKIRKLFKISKKYLNFYNFFCFIFIFTIFALSSSSVFYFFASLSPIKIGQSYSIKITDSNNSIIEETIYDNKGEYVELAKIPRHVQEAFIAIEDPTFYQHNGINPDRIIKALTVNALSGEIEQGGSTITQQFARNLYLNTDKSIFRKIREAYYAINIETYYSKNRILEGYLNSIFLGHGIYGIEVAAKYYFNKYSYQLTIAEGALLAGICSAPNYYSPKVSLERAKMKQELVLYKMFEQNFITAKQYFDALTETLNFSFQLEKEKSSEKNYYINAIEQQLNDLGIMTKKNLAKGLIIETNIDLNLTSRVQKVIETLTFDETAAQLAVVIMKPYSNEVSVLIGGSNYQKYGFNRATNAYRQIGSTIKPLLFYLGLKNGLDPSSEFLSEESNFFIRNFGQYSPANSDGKYANRKINMIEALGTSDNIYAIKTLLKVGSKNLAESLKYFTNRDYPALPSLGLGTAEMSPLELTSIYNTFASEGTYYKPQLINKVTDARGKLIYQNKNTNDRILDTNNTVMLNQMMLAPFDSILAQNSYRSPTLINYKPTHPWGAKTGSTKENSWVVGFNPNYTIGIYVGTDDNIELEDTTLSRRLFQKIANEVSRDLEPTWYPPSYKLMAKKVEPVTLSSATNGSIYYFPKLF